jgi:hypothetical protein
MGPAINMHLDGLVNKTAHGDPSITQPLGGIASFGVGHQSINCWGRFAAREDISEMYSTCNLV